LFVDAERIGLGALARHGAVWILDVAEGDHLCRAGLDTGRLQTLIDAVTAESALLDHMCAPRRHLGCAVAHLVLARQPAASIRLFLAAYANGAARGYDAPWVARYAAAEIMRRLIGVAQLPIPASTGARAELLERSRWAMLAASLAPLAV